MKGYIIYFMMVLVTFILPFIYFTYIKFLKKEDLEVNTIVTGEFFNKDLVFNNKIKHINITSVHTSLGDINLSNYWIAIENKKNNEKLILFTKNSFSGVEVGYLGNTLDPKTKIIILVNGLWYLREVVDTWKENNHWYIKLKYIENDTNTDSFNIINLSTEDIKIRKFVVWVKRDNKCIY